MNEQELREWLADYRAPNEPDARARAWRVVEAGLAERTASSRPPGRRRRRLALAVIAAAAVAAGALTPAGAAVGEWIGEAVNPGRENAQPVLTRLPADGRLLVNGGSGSWVVSRDGSMRRLGDYTKARWSPRGLFVIATRGRQLVALDPVGAVRWSLARSQEIKEPVWSPDGFRVAYLSGDSVRVVAGDGTGDTEVGRDPAIRAPAWRPGADHILAYSDSAGRVTVAQTDAPRQLWRTRAGEPPRELLWTENGARLVAVFERRFKVYTNAGQRVLKVDFPPGTRAVTAAMRPGEASLALTLYRPSTDRSEVVIVPLEGRRSLTRPPQRRLFAGAGRFADLAWSPDGRWLLLTWRDADQWIFVRATGVPRVEAVSNIARQFDPGGTDRGAFPALGGWCCAH